MTSDPIAQRFEERRRALLDLTRRNRLLHFRPTRRTTIRVVDEVPSELFRQLVGEGRAFDFVPAPDARRAPEPVASGKGTPARALPPEALPSGPTADALGVVVSGSPTRCPFCHDAVLAGEPNVACEACLSRHHAECWDEAGRCASCGASHALISARFVRPEATEPASATPAAVGSPPAPSDCGASATPAAAAPPDAPASPATPTPAPPEEAVAPADAGEVVGGPLPPDPEAAPTTAPPPPRPIAPVAVDHDADDGAAREESATYRRVAREELAERHRDRALQTDLPASELERNLVAIARQAASTFEEQGFHALYLALGFLEWAERGSDELQRAPLLLVPVELSRRTVRSRFRLAPVAEDPLLNPALVHKLEQEWGLSLPALPSEGEELDPDAIFEAIATQAAELPRWRVTQDAALALFSFTKFVIYQDLDQHRERALAHPLIRRLLGDFTAAPAGSAAPGTEGDGAEGDGRPPQEVFSVVDADASQREAIDAALRGETLVLEGPPGTGKSQTITNVIAEFLAGGKTVLFVSEKMAALQVVRTRLAEVGLESACLELHSRHTNKREVVRNLARTLEGETPPDHAEDATLAELDGLDERLDELAAALHAPHGALGATPYELLGALEEETPAFAGLVEAGLVATNPAAEGRWTRADLEERERALVAAGHHLAANGPPGVHPLRGLRRSAWSYADRGQLASRLAETREAALGARAALSDLAALLRAPAPTCARDAAPLLELGDLLADPARPDPAVLANPAWDAAPPRAAELSEEQERLRELRGRLAGKLAEALFERDDLPTLAAAAEHYRVRWWRFLAPGWWSTRGAVRAHFAPGYAPELVELGRDLAIAARAQATARRLTEAEGEARALFGRAWDEDRAAQERAGEAARRFRAQLRAGVASRELSSALGAGDAPAEAVAAARAAAEGALGALGDAWGVLAALCELDLAACLGAPEEAADFAVQTARLEEIAGALDRLDAWSELQRALASCAELELGPFLARAEPAQVPPQRLAATLRRAFLLGRLDAALAERPGLRAFDVERHGEALSAFRRLDQRLLALAQVRLRHRLAARRPDGSWAASEGSDLGLLQRELRRKRGHLPVRQLLRRLPGVLLKLKPCLLMSPLSVAQFTDPELHAFDLVVFDEASQITPEDALGALLRGKQAVIVGDSKQMPPTGFFRAAAASEASAASDGFADLESVLDECVASGLPRRVLRWHYRSRHEALIAFSNRHFYEGRLLTFPSPDDGGGRLGVRLRHVEGARYERGGSGQNLAEAEAVAAAVLEHVERWPERSLGVGTFSQAQQEAVLDAVERRLRARPDLEPSLASDRPEHFFVKNLENLQGDERDVIFVSVGYGPDAQGKVALNFGPLNQTGGERRLNVLVTRARERLEVFCSFLPDALDASRSQSRGVHLLKHYLELAARGEAAAATEPPAEHTLARRSVADAIAAALQERLRAAPEQVDLEVARDLGTSQVRVDLAVREGDAYVLGVLLDGPRWGALPSPRDRDRIVPDVFRRLGWQVTRVWALDWHRHRERVLARLLDEVAAARAARAEAQTRAALAAAEAEAAAEAARAAIRLETPSEGGNGGARPVPYEEVPVARRGVPEAFDAVPLAELTELVRAVVAREGPIHEEELERRALAHWELTRSGKRNRQRVSAGADALLEAGALTRRGAFLWPAGLEEPPIRDRSQAGPREAALIPPEELEAALLLVVRHEYRLAADDLVRRAAQLLGFPRAGARLQRACDAALERLVAAGRLAEEHGVVTLPA